MLCVPQGVVRDETRAVPVFEVPGRHTDELMKRYAVHQARGGAWRVREEGIPAINHQGWSWDPLLPDHPNRQEEHGAKATLKALSVPPQHDRVGIESKERG